MNHMLDFNAFREQRLTRDEFFGSLTPADLRRYTNGMIDTMLAIIADSSDADVVFEPEDPLAEDNAAATEAEVNMPWTLGHIVVHTTASAEEAAFIAAELARGVPHRGGRSRREVPWQTVTTIAQCRRRLEESRRMRLASLDVWPDKPDLENHYRRSEDGPKVNAIVRFVGGLGHDDSHLGHLRDVVAQAKAARGG